MNVPKLDEKYSVTAKENIMSSNLIVTILPVWPLKQHHCQKMPNSFPSRKSFADDRQTEGGLKNKMKSLKYSVRRLIGSWIIESAAYCNQILMIPCIPK